MEKWYAVFNHFDPDFVRIFKVEDSKEEKFKDYLDIGDNIVEEITPIQPGKKSLISNDDESLYEIFVNVSDEELINYLKQYYEEMISWYKKKGEEPPYKNEYEDDNIGICFDGSEFEDGLTFENYVKSVNEFIEDSYVDKDSSSQWCWYESEDAIPFSKWPSEYEEEFTDEEGKPVDEAYERNQITYFYQFPWLNNEDIEASKECGLTTSEIKEDGEVVLSGTIEQLDDYCKNYLDYVMVEGYLWYTDEDGVDQYPNPFDLIPEYDEDGIEFNVEDEDIN